MKKLFLLFVFGMFFCYVHSQEKMNFADIDKSTYRAWSEKRWHDLLDTCEIAIDELNTDYFYLRMRAGVAAYELKKYRKAIVHFEKALEFNSGDRDANALLVLSLLNSGFYHNAIWADSADIYKPHIISSVYADYGTCNNNQFEQLKTQFSKPIFNRNLICDKKLNGPFAFSSLFAESELSEKWKLKAGLSYLQMEGFSQMRWDDNTGGSPSPRFRENSFTVKQSGIYIAPVKSPDRTKENTFFVNAFYITSDVVTYNIDGVVMPPVPMMQNPSPVTYLVSEEDAGFRSAEAAIGMNFKRNRTNYSGDLGISVFASQLVKRLQVGYTFSFYPFSRSGFSSSTSVFGLAGNGLSPVLKQSFSLRFGRFCAIEPYMLFGDIRYFSDNNGSVVYNLPETVKLKAGINASVTVLKRFDVIFGYSYSECSTDIVWNDFIGFSNGGKPKFRELTEKATYTNQLIYGGLLCRF